MKESQTNSESRKKSLFQFRLPDLILFTVLGGVAMLIYFRNDCWVLQSVTDLKNLDSYPEVDEELISIGPNALGPGGFVSRFVYIESPDSTRRIDTHSERSLRRFYQGASIRENVQGGKVLFPFDFTARNYIPRFYDDDTVALFVPKPSDPDFNWQKRNYVRRFPEWWWGHFYRPEVWCAIVLAIILLYRLLIARSVPV